MAVSIEASARAGDVGIEPVPPSDRILNAKDLAILWGDLGIGLLVLVTGALLVPGLGFTTALVAIVVGSFIGVGLLAAAGFAGARFRVPTMVLLRPVLGVKGSWIPSALNAGQLIGWTAVELWAMSFVADFVMERSFGVSARWAWLAIAAIVCTALALWGPIGVTRVWLERFGAWMIFAISLIVTVLVFTSGGLGDALTRPGVGGFPTFGVAVDLVIAMPISWLPLVADYTRFADRPRSGFTGTFWGYLVANIWLYALGALLVLGPGAEPSPAAIAGGILAVAGGSIAGVLFLVGLLVGETDEAFANIYSGAVSLQNIFPKAPRRVLSLGVAAVGTILAGWLTMERYEVFLFLIGSVFVPLFGVMAAHYLSAGRDGGERGIAEADRRTPGVRFAALLPWVAGFFVYHWIVPTGPAWWVDAVRDFVGTPLSERFGWLGASIPSFLVAFLLALAAFGLGARARPTSIDAT
ncbi:MAG: nucleobase:cation symporter, family [Actinomycetota bacterium]|nr:nucleobase:cation symporter, family [Actinomycetota bacterium]